jgi:hypothetical protein
MLTEDDFAFQVWVDGRLGKRHDEDSGWTTRRRWSRLPPLSISLELAFGDSDVYELKVLLNKARGLGESARSRICLEVIMQLQTHLAYLYTDAAVVGPRGTVRGSWRTPRCLAG